MKTNIMFRKLLSARKRTFSRENKKSESGQSFTEMTLMFPVVIALLVGVVQFAVMFVIFLTIMQSAREGARFGSTDFDITNQEISTLTKNILSQNLTLDAANTTINVTRVKTNTISGSVSVTSYVTLTESTLGSTATKFTSAEVLSRIGDAALHPSGVDEFVLVEVHYEIPVFFSSSNIPVYHYIFMRVIGY